MPWRERHVGLRELLFVRLALLADSLHYPSCFLGCKVEAALADLPDVLLIFVEFVLGGQSPSRLSQALQRRKLHGERYVSRDARSGPSEDVTEDD